MRPGVPPRLAGLLARLHPPLADARIILGQLVAELMVDGRASTLPFEPFDPKRYVGATHAPTWLEPFGGAAPIQC